MRPDEFSELTYQVADGVATVTLSRPDRRNTWNGRSAAEYRWALHHAHTDPHARVVVLTGAGDFCAGADTGRLSRISSGGGDYAREPVELPPWPEDAPDGLRRNHLAPLLVSTPVIAAITGACAGAGFVLATYADLRFAAADAKITTSFARLGLPAEYGIGWMLPRQVGVPASLEMLYTSEVYDGERARALGWVQRVYPAAELLERTREFARDLARGSSGESLRTMKRQVLIDAAGDLETAYTRSVADMNAALRHPDLAEGLAARKERRPTNFLP